MIRTLQAPRSLPHLGRADPLPETGVYRKRIWKTSHTPTGRDHPPRRLQQHNGTDFGRERSQHPPVRKMRFRMLRKHPAGSGEVRQKTGFEDVSENSIKQQICIADYINNHIPFLCAVTLLCNLRQQCPSPSVLKVFLKPA